jgi:hypothetical protein
MISRCRVGLGVLHLLDPQFASTLQHPEYDGLVRTTLAASLTLVGMLVLLLAAEIGLVRLNFALQGRVERLGFGGMAKPMQHEPRGFLGDADILGELGAGDALLVRRDEVDRHEPLVQPDLAVLEDRPDLDREPLAAVAALVRPVIREMIDLG